MAISSAYLEAFFEVAQTLSFTKAAKHLHITQSALSQRILNLEKELETTLFIRDRAGLRLTEAAHEMVRYCQIKNQLESDFLSNLKNKDPKQLSGFVRIGGFSSVMSSVILPALAPLMKRQNGLRLKLVNQEMSELFGLLKRGEIDYLIADTNVDNDELERINLGVEKNVLVQHRKYSGGQVFLDHDPDDDTTLRYLKLAKQKEKEISRHFLDDIHGLMQGLNVGLGKAVAPLHLIKKEKDLEVINAKIVLEVPVSLYFYAQPYYTKLHQEVVQALIHGVPELL